MACIEGIAFLAIFAIISLIYAFSKKCPSAKDDKEIEYISAEQALAEKNRLVFSLKDEEKRISSLNDYNVEIMKLYYNKYPALLLHQLRDFSRKSDQVYFYNDSLIFIFPFFVGNEVIKNKIEERYAQFIKVRYEDMELKKEEWFEFDVNKPLLYAEFMN